MWYEYNIRYNMQYYSTTNRQFFCKDRATVVVPLSKSQLESPCLLLAGEGDLETERGEERVEAGERERERDLEGVRETDLGEGRRRNRQTVLQGYVHTYCKVAG